MSNEVLGLFNPTDGFPDRKTIERTLKKHNIKIEEYTVAETEFEL